MQSANTQPNPRRASMPVSVNTPGPKSKPAAQKSTGSDTTYSSAASSNSAQSSPMPTPYVLTPVSQLPKGPRRNSRPELMPGDKAVVWDPEHYNPDGSLRTVHKLPGFDQAYAQAMNARYIRHRNVMDREKELSVNQIFDKPEPTSKR